MALSSLCNKIERIHMFGRGVAFTSNEYLSLWLVLLAFACICFSRAE
jgi:hypothetical protein